MDLALQLENVGKRYRIPDETFVPRTILDRLRPRPANDFWALEGIGFTLNHGEALGIIGHNGAGKSTLLKLLSGITAPSTGRMTIRGRLAGLLEVGSGFHPELTGRENIFLSGTILGMTRAEIHRKLDRIIDFAEVRPFIDLPVKRYSSGMYVRLGFSIAAHLEPDILLLDEVLAVGDATFQQKCLKHVQGMRDSGVTVVFISHDLKAVAGLCQRALLLNRGRIAFDGPTDAAISGYQGMRASAAGRRQVRHAELDAEVTKVSFLDEGGREVDHGSTGEPLRFAFEFIAHRPLTGVAVELVIWGSDGGLRTLIHSRREPIAVAAGAHRLDLVCDMICLCPDVYRLDALIHQEGVSEPVDRLTDCRTLVIQSDRPVRGTFHQPHRVDVHAGCAEHSELP